MEKECTRCHKIFNTTKEDIEVCPDCLKKEFSTVLNLNQKELEATEKEYRLAAKRQEQRARRQVDDDLGDTVSHAAGRLRFVFGIVLFLICQLLFVVLSDSPLTENFRTLNDVALQTVSMMFCVVAASLVATSTRRHKFFSFPIAIAILVYGWFMPEIWLKEDMIFRPKVDTTEESQQAQKDDTASERALNSGDLEVFSELRAQAPQITHYAIYMNRQDSRTRSVVRDALTRLLGPEYTRAYTRYDGALYIVTNVPGRMQNITRTLSRFGTVTYASPSEGIYEVRFDPERTSMVSKYPIEVLSTPTNPSYVTANIAELGCLDAMRVRAAAQNFKSSNVQMLRNEIHDALLRALQDPWRQDFDTYTSLVEALVTYSKPGDKAVTDACRAYFGVARSMNQQVPTEVTDYLVREVPEEMVEAVIDAWAENPRAWNSSMIQLGKHVQQPLMKRLSETTNLRMVNLSIKFLKDHGDAAAIPAIKPFTENPDSIIRHTAQEAIEVLEQRK